MRAKMSASKRVYKIARVGEDTYSVLAPSGVAMTVWGRHHCTCKQGLMDHNCCHRVAVNRWSKKKGVSAIRTMAISRTDDIYHAWREGHKAGGKWILSMRTSPEPRRFASHLKLMKYVKSRESRLARGGLRMLTRGGVRVVVILWHDTDQATTIQTTGVGE